MSGVKAGDSHLRPLNSPAVGRRPSVGLRRPLVPRRRRRPGRPIPRRHMAACSRQV